MSCRDEILRVVQVLGKKEFSVQEIVDSMRASGTVYGESTIRTHVASRMCANAPQNHAVKYNDFIRIRHGTYKLA
jgi:hypothetical protein